MASSADRFVIVGRDGVVLADIYGNTAEFSSREEAERWLMPGERAEPDLSSPRGSHDRE